MRADLQIANHAISGDLAYKVMAATDKLCAALGWESDGTGRQLESAAQAMVELLNERNKLVPVVERLRSRLRALWHAIGEPLRYQAPGMDAYDATLVAAKHLMEELKQVKADLLQATDAHAKCRMDLVKISAALGTRDTNIATILDVITRMKETNATLNSEQSSALATERKAHAETLDKLHRRNAYAVCAIPAYPAPHSATRRVCDLVLDDMRRESCTSMERYLARTMLAVLGETGPRDDDSAGPWLTIPGLVLEADAAAAKLGAVFGWTEGQARAIGISGAVDRVVLSMTELGLALDPVHDGGSDVTARTIGDHRETAARAVAELLQLRAERVRVDLLKLRADRLRSHVNVVRVVQHASGIRERRFNVKTTLSAQDRRVFDDLNKAVDDLRAEQDSNDVAGSSTVPGSLPVLHIAIASLITAMSTDQRDWSKNPTDSWLYGVIVGWSRQALAAVVEQHGMAESAEAVISGANAAVAEFLAARP